MDANNKRQRENPTEDEDGSIQSKRIKTEGTDEVVMLGNGHAVCEHGNPIIEDPKNSSSAEKNDRHPVDSSVADVLPSKIQALRDSVKDWLKRCENLNPEDVHAGIENLVLLRKDCGDWDLWYKEVLRLREVQKNIMFSANHLKHTAEERKASLIEGLKAVLNPVENIEEKHFPKVREVIKNVYSGVTRKPFKIKSIRQLPAILEEEMKKIPSDDEIKNSDVIGILERLETTIKLQLQNNEKPYPDVLCILIVQLFGWNCENQMFGYSLSNIDLISFQRMLDEHMKQFESLRTDKERQAYLLDLALCLTSDKKSAVEYVVEHLPVALCKDFKDVLSADDDGFEKLQRVVDPHLRSKHTKLKRKSLIFSIKTQLYSLHQPTRVKDVSGRDGSEQIPLNADLKVLIDILGLKDYYPQKLTYEDVITLKPDVLRDFTSKPSTVVEVPWYFLKHIIGLDSETRESCRLVNSGSDSDMNYDSDDDINADIHPLDLIYILFLCSEDFLRKELVDKMVKMSIRCSFYFTFASVRGRAGKGFGAIFCP